MIKNFRAFGQEGQIWKVGIDGKDSGTIDILDIDANPTLRIENNRLDFCLLVNKVPTTEEFLELVSGGFLLLQDGEPLGINL